ncbi:Vacuolar protein sorting-associated protein 37B [Merluccius polli]|uniref:Vacuolar protein sorting-associated protein 37B n=1 Tax=Merluccius polli TaxID=89951 RepID=A0AA47MWH4_MERPO|nr:Vacuolar protein sorting-associated protein 37B [Merluccius polli]
MRPQDGPPPPGATTSETETRTVPPPQGPQHQSQSLVRLSLVMSAPFALLRVTDLRRLLDDEETCTTMIRYSDKFQRLTRATENILVSNHRLAKGSLLHEPAFREARMLLAAKHKESERLLRTVTAKQSDLDAKYTGLLHTAQLSLVKTISSAEQESEVLFQRFVEGKTPVGDFLEGFQHLRRLYHVRLVLVNKIRDTKIPALTPRGPPDVPGDTEPLSPSPDRPLSHTGCHPVCRPAPLFILPAIGQSLAYLPVVHPMSGALRDQDLLQPLQQVMSYRVDDHQHHHHQHHHHHQQHHPPLCPRRGRKPTRLQKVQIKPGRRGPGPD